MAMFISNHVHQISVCILSDRDLQVTVLTTSMAHWPCLCRCERNDVRVTGPHSPAEEHVDYEVEVGYVKVCIPAPSSTAYVMHD